jgi:uncharacterized protein involved in exopolysaccharide biosynthesis
MTPPINDTHLPAAQKPPTSPMLTLQEVFSILWPKRRVVLLVAAIVGLLTLVLNFFVLPLTYLSTATILPDIDKNKVAAMGQLQNLASLAGLVGGTSDVSRLYPMIAVSEAVLTGVITQRYKTMSTRDSVDLIQYMHLDEGTPEKNMDEALKRLRKSMTVTNDSRTNIVTLQVELTEPQLAADVLNAVIAHIDAFMRLKRTTSASEQGRWVDERLHQVERELRVAEEALKNFREKNRRVADSPELLLQQERFVREVTVKSTITIELKKQLELARIEEIRNTPVVNILDSGRAPVRKEHPSRATNTLLAFVLTAVACAAYFVLNEKYGARMRASIVNITQGTRKTQA